MMDTEIHWHEGLFLQPHHLQKLQRNLIDRFGAERRLAWSYPYGVIDAELSRDDLENFRIRFTRLSVIMPNGIFLRFPENAELSTLDIKRSFHSHSRGFMVYLGIPDWFEQRPNVIQGTSVAGERIKLRYRVPELPEEVYDENTGKNPKPLLMRRYNAVYLLDDDDDTDMVKIPLLRVIPDVSREEPVPRPDPEYVPPSIHLGASRQLRHLVSELSQQIDLVRGQLAHVLSRDGFEMKALRGIQIEQLFRLRSLNRFTARISCLLDVGDGGSKVPTFDVYMELRELLAELMALFPERGRFEPLKYQHDDAYPCFQAVAKQIRNYLHGAVEPNFMKIPLDPAGEAGKLKGFLEDKHIDRPTAYFLGISTSQEPSSLVRLVEDTELFKLMPPTYERVAVRGVLLNEERYPPLELPSEPNLYFFRLATTKSRKVWDEILDERAVTLQWTTSRDIPDFKAALYMTLPPDDAPYPSKQPVATSRSEVLPTVEKRVPERPAPSSPPSSQSHLPQPPQSSATDEPKNLHPGNDAVEPPSAWGDDDDNPGGRRRGFRK